MNILVIGASGHAKIIIDTVERLGRDEIVGLTTEDGHHDGAVCGYPVLGKTFDVVRICEEHSVDAVLVGIGDNWSRSEVVRQISEVLPGSQFCTAVHPSAEIARCVNIGTGTVVMAGAVINSGARIGRHCIVNTRASVDHDCVIGDFVSVGPGATLGGDVRIGNCTAVGIGATLIHRLTVGDHSVIGAGAVVVKDQPSCVVAYGTPARVIRHRNKADKYL